MNIQAQLKMRRERVRWFLLIAAWTARPEGISTMSMLDSIQGTYEDISHQEIRRELDYLEERNLVHIKKDPLDRWFVELTRYGFDVVEYTVECDPGIARPLFTQN